MDSYNFEEIYKIFKDILGGCRTMIDAFYFAEKIISNNPEYKELVIGMIYNKKYDKVLDFRTLAHTLNELNSLEYREDIDDFLNKNIKNNFDEKQLNTFLRLSKTKPNKVNEVVKNKYCRLNINIEE